MLLAVFRSVNLSQGIRINATFGILTSMNASQTLPRDTLQQGWRLALKVFLAGVLYFLLALQAFGATVQSNGTGGGDWNNPASWSGGSVPLAGDDVIILAGDQINATSSQSCTHLEIRGILNFGTNSVTISVSGNLTLSGTGSTTGNQNSRSLNVSGNLNSLTGADGAISGINLTINGITNLQGRIDFNNTTGSKTLTGTVTIADGGTIDFSAGVSLILLSDLIMSGNSVLGGVTAGTGTLIGVSSFTVNAGANASVGRVTMAIVGATTINGNLTFTINAGSKSFIGACTITNGSIEFTGAETASFNSSITVNGTSSLGGTSSSTGGITSTGDLTISAGANVTIGRVNLTINGTSNISGSTNINNTNGTKTLSGNVNLPGTGTLSFSAAETVDIGGDLSTSPGSTLGGGSATGIVNLNGNYNVLTGGTSTLNTLTITVNGSLSIAGTGVLNTSGGSPLINLLGNWSVTSSNPNAFVEGTSRVFFVGTGGAQSISTTEAGGETFYTVSLGNSSGANPSITTSVNINARSFSITTGILDLQGRNIVVTGDGTNSTDNYTGSVITSVAGSMISITDPSVNKTVNFTNVTFGNGTNSIPVTMTSANSTFEGSTFFGTLNVTKTGNAQNTCNGGNIFHQNTTFTTQAGADRWAMASVNPDTFNADATFVHNGNSNWRMARCIGNVYNGTTTFTNNSTGFIYLGRINNTTNGSVTFNGPVIVNIQSSGTVQFSESDAGIQNTATFASTIQLNSTAGSTGNITFGSTGFGSTTLTATGRFINGTLLGNTIVTMIRLTQNGNAFAQTMSAAGNSVLTMGTATAGDGSVFNASVTFSFPQIQLRQSTFNGSTNSFTQTGSTNNSTFGGNTFAAGTSTTFTNQGTGFWRLGNSGADDFNGNVTFIRLGTGALDASYANNTTYAGTVSTVGTATAITFGNGGGRSTFDGAGAMNINGSAAQPPVFTRLTIAGSGGLTLNVPISVTTDITFTNGTINTTSTNILTLNAGSSLSGTPSNTCHVDGPIRKVGNTAFTFPTGDGGFYRAIGISAPGNAADAFTAEYFKSAQAFGAEATYSNGLLTVSACEYWVLNRVVGTSNVNVTLSWVSADCTGPYIDPTGLASLRVARWNNTNWVSHGNGGTTGTSASGTITTSAPVTSFSPFTLASVSLINPLPIELQQFDATAAGQHVIAQWVTASETNNDFFTLERSKDGMEFAEVGIVKGQGTSNTRAGYEFVDMTPLSGISYYRLKQTDFDKKFTYSDIVKVNRDEPEELVVFPNPAHRVAHVNFRGNFVVVNNLGQVALKVVGGNTFDLSNLSPGVYLIRDDQGRSARLVVE